MTKTLRQILETDGVEAYHQTLKKIMLDPLTFDDAAIEEFYAVENAAGMYADSQYQKFYSKIFNDFATTVLLKKIRANEFQMTHVLVAALVARSENQVNNAELKKLIDPIARLAKTQNDDYAKLVFSSLLYVCRVFSNQKAQAKISFLKDAFDLNVEKIMPTEDQVRGFGLLFRSVFSNLEELAELAGVHVFGKDFLSTEISKQKNRIIWILRFVWGLYNDQTLVSRLFYPMWHAHFLKAVSLKNTELICFMHVPLTHLLMNTDESAKGIERSDVEVSHVVAQYFSELKRSLENADPVKKPQAVKNKKKRLGFVYPRLTLNSPGKLLYSLVSSLHSICPDEFDIYIYNCEVIEAGPSLPQFIEAFKPLIKKYTNLHSTLDDAHLGFHYSVFGKCEALKKQIAADEIDVLVSGNGNVYSDYLFVMRLAPIQFYWCHGDEYYDVPGIDLRVRHEMSGPGKTVDYSVACGKKFYKFAPGMNEEFYIPDVDPRRAQLIKARFGENVVIMGTITRIIKLRSEHFLDTVCAILNQNPNSVYLACCPDAVLGNRDYEFISEYLKKINCPDRFIFEGQVDAGIYGGVIDLFLDTFPIHQGESIMEFRAKGGVALSLYPTITENHPLFLSKELDVEYLPHISSRQAPNSYDRLSAFSKVDYVNVATHLIRNVVHFPECKAKIREYWWFLDKIKNELMNKQACAERFKGIVDWVTSGCQEMTAGDVDKKWPSKDEMLAKVVDLIQDQKWSGKKLLILASDHVNGDLSIKDSLAFGLAARLNELKMPVSIADSTWSLHDLRKVAPVAVKWRFDEDDVLIFPGARRLFYFDAEGVVSLDQLRQGQVFIDVYGILRHEKEKFTARGVTYVEVTL